MASATLADLGLVFVAGLLTALATGLGAVPFFLVEEISDRWNVVLWGLASGIMVSASVFGLIQEGRSSTEDSSTPRSRSVRACWLVSDSSSSVTTYWSTQR